LLRLSPDSRLVALIREGRTAAFEVAYDRHHRSILSFCRHMLGDLEEAQDAVQHTFLVAYSDLLSSDKPVHLKAWLFTIARNRCYSILRGRREQPTGELADAHTEGLAAQVQRRQDLRDLIVDMRQLPDNQRAALVLAELESLSHEEIAQVLGVPKGKVKALVFQARESLIASRTARETDCAEIREQLTTLHGAALRRGTLRRHLRECAGCREFRKQVERQKRHLALLLPVGPGIAFKKLLVGGTVAGGAVGAISGGGLPASSIFKGGLVKLLVGAALAGVGTAGTLVVAHQIHTPKHRPLSAPQRATRAISAPPAHTPAAHHARRPAAERVASYTLGSIPVSPRHATHQEAHRLFAELHAARTRRHLHRHPSARVMMALAHAPGGRPRAAGLHHPRVGWEYGHRAGRRAAAISDRALPARRHAVAIGHRALASKHHAPAIPHRALAIGHHADASWHRARLGLLAGREQHRRPSAQVHRADHGKGG
jgi:RNA polymerase sigma factor (sigma-70 family)